MALFSPQGKTLFPLFQRFLLRRPVAWLLLLACIPISCAPLSATYSIAKNAVRATFGTANLATGLAITTGEMVYRMGKFTFKVVMAPLDWPMTHDIEDIDDLPPKEAIRQDRVKNSPYTVLGKRYYPYSVDAAKKYREVGIASWYGYETYNSKGGRMTANGEAFDPRKLSAAHKLLPLPAHVRVTNLDNGRSLIVRVNDRGPFVPGRIIDLSAGAAKKLGFHRKGTARVRVETVEL